MQKLEQSRIQDPAKHHNPFEKLRVPGSIVITALALLAGCARRPEATIQFESDGKLPSIKLVADDVSHGPDFKFSSLFATFGKPGDYKIMDPKVQKTWTISVSSDDVGKSITLNYDRPTTWCAQYGYGSSTISVMRATEGKWPDVGTGHFTSQRVR